MESKLVCISCNVGGTLASDEAPTAFLNLLDERRNDWNVAYISECDGHLTNDFELNFESHCFHRHHEDGSKPMVFC